MPSVAAASATARPAVSAFLWPAQLVLQAYGLAAVAASSSWTKAPAPGGKGMSSAGKALTSLPVGKFAVHAFSTSTAASNYSRAKTKGCCALAILQHVHISRHHEQPVLDG